MGHHDGGGGGDFGGWSGGDSGGHHDQGGGSWGGEHHHHHDVSGPPGQASSADSASSNFGGSYGWQTTGFQVNPFLRLRDKIRSPEGRDTLRLTIRVVAIATAILFLIALVAVFA